MKIRRLQKKLYQKAKEETEPPFLSALRQDVLGRHSGPCLHSRKIQSVASGMDGETFQGL